jgi:hypothetical protein
VADLEDYRSIFIYNVATRAPKDENDDLSPQDDESDDQG